MSYGGYASSVISKKNDLSFVVINVNNLGFDNVWKSNASQKLLTSLKDVLDKINKENSNLNTFANAIRRIDECIEIDNKITKLEQSLLSLDADDDDYEESVMLINSQIATLKEDKEKIKNEIKASLSGFGAVDSSTSMLYSPTRAISWNELSEKVGQFSSLPSGNIIERLTIRDANGNVIRDGKEYIDNTINSIKRRYTGTERNYLVSLAMIDLSLEAGVRVPYEHNGTRSTGKGIDTRIAVPTSAFSRGIDCNAFASYVIFDENSTEKWLSVKQFASAGEKVSYENAQPGDIFANGGHVGMIVDYNAETGEYIILHASGQEVDMRLQKVNENYFKGNGHSIRRVDSTYVSPALQEIIM